jgi:hypothetical protein
MIPSPQTCCQAEESGFVQLLGVPLQVHPDSTAQDALQPSLLFTFASSQVSPTSIFPLPQTDAVEVFVHWLGDPSQLHPVSIWHIALQPSLLFTFVSSHVSPVSTLPLPQTAWPDTAVQT